MTSNDTARLIDVVEALRDEVRRLEARISDLDGRLTAVASAMPEEAMDADTVLAVAGALAAYFGKKPKIRSIRLLGSDVWAHQGRASTQAAYSVSQNPTK